MFLSELITRGGPVLYLLFILTLIIFYILFNKYSFIFFDKKTWSSSKLDKFIDENPPETTKLFFVEKTFLSEFRRDSFSNIKLLDGLIGMCPMIGLLGTVYGMIEVFEVLSFLGTGNPRAMSSGVAKATIPTMASMVITLFGLYFRQDISQRLDKSSSEIRTLLKRRGYSH
tara:strand:+ start:1937 stop:2449 length:513 start_codon:yes stop_codon:yes gene_type:complete